MGDENILNLQFKSAEGFPQVLLVQREYHLHGTTGSSHTRKPFYGRTDRGQGR